MKKKTKTAKLQETIKRESIKIVKQPTIFDMVENLEIKDNFKDIPDLKKAYYEDNKAKWGF